MGRNKKITAIAVSCATIMVSAGIATAATYALFTDTVTLTNHLVAGNLDITLKRTNLEYTYIDSEGMQQTKTDSTVKDFSNPTTDNIFGFVAGDKFVPTDYRKATMQLSNSSTVAYGYYLEIKLNGDANEFAEQLLISVDTDTSTAGYEYTAHLDEGLVIGDKTNPIGLVKVGSTADFIVKVSFDDLDTNNDAQDQEVDFDLIVHAIQKVK